MLVRGSETEVQAVVERVNEVFLRVNWEPVERRGVQDCALPGKFQKHEDEGWCGGKSSRQRRRPRTCNAAGGRCG